MLQLSYYIVCKSIMGIITYKQNSDLPKGKGVKNNLPLHTRDIYRKAYNHLC